MPFQGQGLEPLRVIDIIGYYLQVQGCLKAIYFGGLLEQVLL